MQAGVSNACVAAEMLHAAACQAASTGCGGRAASRLMGERLCLCCPQAGGAEREAAEHGAAGEDCGAGTRRAGGGEDRCGGLGGGWGRACRLLGRGRGQQYAGAHVASAHKSLGMRWPSRSCRGPACSWLLLVVGDCRLWFSIRTTAAAAAAAAEAYLAKERECLVANSTLAQIWVKDCRVGWRW